jgi:uncharacterized delta-60 repeat protein
MKTKKQTIIKKLVFVFILIILSFFNGYSQIKTFQIIPPDGVGDLEEPPLLEQEPPTFNFSPEGKLETIYDRFGNKLQLKDIFINNPQETQQRAITITCSSTSYFNLYFDVGSGMENTSDPAHNARRAIVCKVFEDISNFINSPLTTTGNKVNIWVKDITSTGAPAGTLGLASSFYISPNSAASVIGGVLDGEIWKTIHLGSDSYANVSSNSNLFYHGEIAFNFADPTIQWHTNLASNAPNTLYDLYTVVLHEVIHALGFTSFIGPNGTSLTNANYYSRYDTFLRTNNNISLLTIGSCSMYDVIFNAVVSPTVLRPGCTLPNNLGTGTLNTTLCNNAIKYVGSTTVPVYTPTCFELGSSLGHFEDQLYPTCAAPYGNDTYFVASNAIGTGVTKRYPKPEERKALCDSGYSVKTIFGVNTTTSGYFNYGGTVCSGITVAGLNDGINSSGGYAFVGTITTAGATSNTVAISNLLANDVNATGFECLQSVYYPTTTTFTATAGTASTIINFTTTTAGLHLLRYIPINGTQKGNITYIYVYIIAPPNPGGCSPTPTACDLVMNGDFEQYSSLPTQFQQIIRACGWDWPHINPQFSPSYFNSNVNLPSAFGANMVDIPCNVFGVQDCKNNNGNGYAAIRKDYSRRHLKTNLKEPLQANTNYQLSFDVSLLESTSSYASNLQACLSSTNASLTPGPIPPAHDLDFGIDPNILLTSPTITRNVNGWETITFNFTTTTGGENKLYLGLLKDVVYSNNIPTTVDYCLYNNINNPFFDWVKPTGYYIDNVSLIPTNGAKFDLPDSICNTQTFPNLSAYLSSVVTSGAFSGTGVINTNGVYSFNAALAGVGVVSIGYTYTNASGCSITLYDTINVTTTATNTNTVTAINDDLTSLGIDSFVGGVTTSVYVNDLYNGTASTFATLANVSFQLVTPLSIPGASIDSNGYINVPAGTLAGTYTLKYSVTVPGNCNATSMATATILVVNSVTPTIVQGIRANDTVMNIDLQSTGKSIIAGNFTTYNNINRTGFARLNTNLTLDASFISSGTNNPGFPIQDLAIQNDNKIIAVGKFTGFSGGTNGANIARLLPNGGIDTSFNIGGTGITSISGVNSNIVYCVKLLPNGDILAGGDFNGYNGVQKNSLVKIKPDGTIDNTFNLPVINGYRNIVKSIAVQVDGKIIINGFFNLGSNGAISVIRILPNGSIDNTFTQGVLNNYNSNEHINLGSGWPINKILIQPDGKIIVAGAFTKYNGYAVKSIVRLLSTGNIDLSFFRSNGVDNAIYDVILEPTSNKILIGGVFNLFGTTPIKKIIRLNTNGTLDTSFSIGTGTSHSNLIPSCPLCKNFVWKLKEQLDGKIIVGGSFTTFNGLSATNITRIFGSSGVQARFSAQVFQSEPEIDTNPNFNTILVYPNPSKDIFNIDLTQETETYNSISIFNILGEKVVTSTLIARENNSINLSHLANGYYLAKLENQVNSVTLKLIKN